MSAEPFSAMIPTFLESNWNYIIFEAYNRCSYSSWVEAGTKEHATNLKVYAQSVLVSRLESKKGDWLTFAEMEYTLDLFEVKCQTEVCFGVLKGEGWRGQPPERRVAESVAEPAPPMGLGLGSA
jgi:hypothetical protein